MPQQYTNTQYMRYVHRKIVSQALQEMINVTYEQLEFLKKRDSEK